MGPSVAFGRRTAPDRSGAATRPKEEPMTFLRVLAAAACGMALALSGGAAFAQPYPSKPIRMVIAFPPGGTSDFVGRVVAAKMSEFLGPADRRRQQARRDRPHRHAGGPAGGPDGYTILLALSDFTLIPGLQAEAAVRPGQGLRGDRAPHQLSARARRVPGAAREQREGAHRAREGEAGRDQLRIRRQRRVPTTFPASRSRTRRASTSRTCRTRATAPRSPTSSPTACSCCSRRWVPSRRI